MVDFPRAWEIARAVPVDQHHPRCSYTQTKGGILCDCHVLFDHAEYISLLRHTAGGALLERQPVLENPGPELSPWYSSTAWSYGDMK